MHATDKWIWNQLTGMDLCKMKNEKTTQRKDVQKRQLKGIGI